jgi:hypothetical protein
VFWHGMRSDPRYSDLLHRIGLRQSCPGIDANRARLSTRNGIEGDGIAMMSDFEYNRLEARR